MRILGVLECGGARPRTPGNRNDGVHRDAVVRRSRPSWPRIDSTAPSVADDPPCPATGSRQGKRQPGDPSGLLERVGEEPLERELGRADQQPVLAERGDADVEALGRGRHRLRGDGGGERGRIALGEVARKPPSTTSDGLSTFTALASAVERMPRCRASSAATGGESDPRAPRRAWLVGRVEPHGLEQARAADLVLEHAGLRRGGRPRTAMPGRFWPNSPA